VHVIIKELFLKWAT